MRCPKCNYLMLGGNDQGRQSGAGEGSAMLSVPMYYCSNCNKRIYPDIPPVLPMSDEMKLESRAKKDGTDSGWRKGLVVSPAAVLAEAQFSRITRLLRGRVPWATIAQMFRDESGERFKVDTLQQYYQTELERRRLINKAKYNETRRKKAGAV